MSANLRQIFLANPTTTFQSTDEMYLVRSPFAATDDFGFTYSSLIPVNTKGDLFTWSTLAIRLAVGANGTFLTPDATTATGLKWSTATLPATTTINQVLYSSAANVVSGLATGNDGVLVTGATGIPSISSTLPTAVQGNITSLGTIASGTWQGTIVGTIYGGTGLNSYIIGDTIYSSGTNVLTKLSGNTTTAKMFLSQTGTGAASAAPLWEAIDGGDVTGAALTKTDDTNVTLTLGGTPTTALLQATSITAGWTGQLSLARGGTNASLVASAGAVPYSTATEFSLVPHPGGTNQIFVSTGISSAPHYTLITIPDIIAINSMLVANSANALSALSAGNNCAIQSSGAGVISFNTQLAVAAGGTGTGTAFTTGSVIFAGASGVYTQDNANLFFDDTNNRLGIGTAAPSVRLDMEGVFNIYDTAKTYPAGIVTEVSSSTINYGINDSRFGSHTAGNQGGFIRLDARAGEHLLQLQARPASGALAAVLRITSSGDIILGPGSLATNATVGFPSMPSCAGTPIGAPTNYAGGFIPFIYDSTNNLTYVYNAAWRNIVGTGGTSITTLGTIATGTWQGTVVGVTYGGTGTATNFTQGSVVFAGASGVYTQDNANLFFDNANNRLGVGTASPTVELDVIGSGVYSVGLNVGFAEVPTADALRIGDTNFKLDFNAGDPIIHFQAADGDYFQFNRTSNTYRWVVGAVEKASLNSAGDFAITGALSKGSGTFTIDHPLDPLNKILQHSFVESPDMMNVYNGNAVCDVLGNATILLPSYFEALNMDYRYQLACIGMHSPVYVSSEISNNQFTISGGVLGQKVSWQVTGIRNDSYAQKHRVQVEINKSDLPNSMFQKGEYRHPDCFHIE